MEECLKFQISPRFKYPRNRNKTPTIQTTQLLILHLGSPCYLTLSETRIGGLCIEVPLSKITHSGEYVYKPWAFDTILIYLYMCVILVSVNISE